jgi:hypothetical protein
MAEGTQTAVVQASTNVTTVPTQVFSLTVQAEADAAVVEIRDGDDDTDPLRARVKAPANDTRQVLLRGLAVNALRVRLVAGTTPFITVEYV